MVVKPTDIWSLLLNLEKKKKRLYHFPNVVSFYFLNDGNKISNIHKEKQPVVSEISAVSQVFSEVTFQIKQYDQL